MRSAAFSFWTPPDATTKRRTRVSLEVATYSRVSTSDQHCELQVHELREYAARRAWTVAAEYVDTGISGAKASRPELDRLIHAACRRAFDVVLVYKLDRFGRSVRNCLDGISTLRTHGVRFLAVSQNIDTDENNPHREAHAAHPGRRCRVRAGVNPGARGVRSGQRQAPGQTAGPAKSGIRPRKSPRAPTARPQLPEDRAGARRWAGDGR